MYFVFITVEDFTRSGAVLFLTYNKQCFLSHDLSITTLRTSSVVTEPQEEEKGKLRKPKFVSTVLVLFLLVKLSRRL